LIVQGRIAAWNLRIWPKRDVGAHSQLNLCERFVTSTISADWYLAARERCHALAVEMVRLDHLAAVFESEGQYVRADRVRFDRESVREDRSKLLREVWRKRRVSAPPRRPVRA